MKVEEREKLDMVKHIIIWKLKDELSEEDKKQVKKGIKEGLEGLQGKVPGLLGVKVQIDNLPSSSCDLMLDSSLEDEEALKAYAVNPLHVKVMEERIKPYVAIRSCIDFLK